MVEVKVGLQINAPIDKVWDIISDIDNDREFWHGITLIRNISKDRNVVTREVTKGKVNKCLQTVTLFPKEGINIHWIKGAIVGTKDILLTPIGNMALLEIEMNYKFSGVTSFLSGHITKDLQLEAEQALQLVKKRAEGQSNDTMVMIERKTWADLVNAISDN